MTDNFYVKKQENKDRQILKQFNDDLNYFQELNFTPDKTRHDATAIDRRGRKVVIEIKQREGKYKSFDEFKKKYNSCYLSTDKLPWFEKVNTSGRTLNEQQLFITIFDDGDTILLFNLSKTQEVLLERNTRVYNPMKKCWQYEDNLGFKIENAIIYKRINGHYQKIQK